MTAILYSGLPNLSNIFQFDLNINMPDINFNLDLDVFNHFALINWDCSVQVKDVCRAGTGAVSVNCGELPRRGYQGKWEPTTTDTCHTCFEYITQYLISVLCDYRLLCRR